MNYKFEQNIFKKAGLINDHFVLNANRHFVPDQLFLLSLSANNLDYVGGLRSEVIGSTIGESLQEAEVAAMGEFIERFVATSNQHCKYFGSADDFEKSKNNVIDLNQFNFFKPSQYKSDFPYVVYDKQTKMHWVDGKDFHTQENVLIPESLVYLIRRNGEVFFPSTSTGLACGYSKEHAIQSGFLEASERNAFSQFWYLQRNEKRIKYNKETVLKTYGDNNSISLLYDNKRIEFVIFDLTKFTLTKTYLVFAEFYIKGEKYFSVGCSSRFKAEDALIKAAKECYQGIDYAIRIREEKKNLDLSNDYRKIDLAIHINEFRDHFWFYNAYPKAKEKVPIFRDLANRAKDSFCQSMIQHQHTIMNLEEFKQLNIPMYVADLSIQEYVDLGFYTYRVVIPDFILLTGQHSTPIIGSPKFKNEKLFTELPHFFP